MNKKLILLFALFSFSASFAQKMYEGVKIDQGDLKLEVGRDVDVSAVFKVSDGYVVYKKEPIRGPGGWHYYIEKYDNNLVSQSIQDISAQFERDGYIMQDFIKLGDNYVLFSTKDFPDEATEKLFFQKIDSEKGELSAPKFIYAEAYQGQEKNIDFSLVTSPDRSMVLLRVKPPFLKEDHKMFNFYVFDEQMEKLWKQEHFIIKGWDTDDKFFNTLLSDNGSVYFSVKVYDETPGAVKHAYKCAVVMISEDTTKIQPIRIKDFGFTRVSLEQGKDGEIYTAGFAFNNNIQGAGGVSLLFLDPVSLEIVDERWYKFSEEFVTTYWGKEAFDKMNKQNNQGKHIGIPNLEFRKVVTHDDGTITVVGENVYFTRDAASQTGTSSYTTHYAQLITSRISEDGMVNAIVYKDHTRSGAYIFFNLNNELVVLTDDARWKAGYPPTDGLSRADKKLLLSRSLLIFNIEDDGDVQTSMLIDYFDPKYANYRPFFYLRDQSFLIREGNKVELMLETHMDAKQFAITRLTFD